MRKTDKNIEKALVEILTGVCNFGQKEWEGFEWLTHFVNYNKFPESLLIVCVFDTIENTLMADKKSISEYILKELSTINIKIKNHNRCIILDNEENCLIEENGNWSDRFKNK